MPRGGKNHARGGEIAQGGKFSRAQDSIFLPPLANFSCTPLAMRDPTADVARRTT